MVLGAGLDTLAYRTPLAGRLRIFEVDHPATQARKREMLAAAAIAVPETLSFVPVDFEREKLSERLEAAGFKSTRAQLFQLAWRRALSDGGCDFFDAWLSWRSCRAAAEVVFDYVNPATSVRAAGRAAHQALAARVAAAGERFQSYLDTAFALRKNERGRFSPCR